MAQSWQGKAWTNVSPVMLSKGDISSVWNWNTGRYDYYKVPTFSRRLYSDEVKPPPAGQALGGIGEDPDFSSHPLPLGSHKVGSGDQALGDIVSLPRTTMGIATWAALALAIGVPVALLLSAAHLSDLFRGQDVYSLARNDDDEL